MNLGEFIIKIGTQGDTKELEKAITKLEEAEKKTRRAIKLQQDLAKATSDEEKALIKKNAAQQDELEGLRAVKSEHDALNGSVQKNIASAFKFIGVIGATVTMLDRLGNSLLKSNQMYITFEKQTDISISRLNRMAGLAQLAGTNLSPEQVAGDLQSMQQKIFSFERFGENAKTFGMLGINPRGMKSDQLILALRNSLKKYNGEVRSYYLNQLGLSQEWLNILDLSDDKFNEYLKTSKKLQLSEKERKQLAKYTAKQQENNMRWELAKQKLLISVMPLIQQIMEATSKIALHISSWLNAHPKWIDVLKDVLILMAGSAVLKTITSLTKLLSMGGGLLKALAPLGAIFGLKGLSGAKKGLLGGIIGTTGGKGLAKLVGKKGLGAALGIVGKRAIGALGGAFSGPIGAIFSIVMILATIKDLFELFMNKQEKEENEPTPDPDEGGNRYQYSNYKSNMTNNFFNNPQPAQEAIQQLTNFHNLILAEQYR